MSEKKPQRGRPRDDRSVRKGEILAAAMNAFLASGYHKVTSLAVAKACGMSKATLYSYFPSKEDLFIALIELRAAAMNSHLAEDIEKPDLAIEDALNNLGRSVLKTLTSDISLAINRTAISTAASQDLGFSNVYEKVGRLPTMARVEAILEAARRRGVLVIENMADAKHDLYGLLVGDVHNQLLLGVGEAPGEKQINDGVARAVRQFMRLYGLPSSADHGLR